MKFIDLFSGVGGFTRGLQLAGHECIGHCEFDKFAEASYRAMHNTPTTYDSDEYPLATQLEGMAFRQLEILGLIEKQPIVSEKKEWNKLTFRPLTEEEEEDYSNQEWTYIIDGLPDLGEEVLVTDGKYVWIDIFNIDDFVYLSNTDNEVDRVKAWMELPKPDKDV